MAKILVAYYSKTGHTKQMAESVVEGAVEGDADVDCKTVDRLDAKELLDYDGLIVGSPVYYGQPAAPVKELIDISVGIHGRLAGRVGAAFAASANIGGGNETTCLALLQMMLVHGMIVVGSAEGGHYGPAAVGAPDDRARKQCQALGNRVAQVAKLLERGRG